ncbi:hypothetical protein BDV98DRAFT_587333 [Pterulicium gracile]|uniref:Uncharacterized protein n=1 Tax=Pterulicium gracile TaxID=1884261 RepID=A0A5C3Q1W4_9AGAR|nr:hypothetical protein BDV98DRAFT_587333 [Pterula gracilis]
MAIGEAQVADITSLFAFYGTTQNFDLFYNPQSNYLDSLRQAGLNNQDVLRFGQDIYNRETVIARSQPESNGIHLYRCLNEGRRPTPPLDRDTSTAYKPLFHHALDISKAPHLFDRYVSFAFKEASIHNPFTASHPLQTKGHQPNYESMANCMLMTLATPFQAVPSNQAINEQLAKPWSSASEHYPALPISATAEHKAMASTIRIARERTKVDGPMEVFLATRANIIGLVEIVRVLLTDAGDSSSVLKRIRSWVNLLDIAIHFSLIVALTCSRLEDVTASLLLKLSFLCAGKKSTDVIRAEDLIWQTIFNKLARPPHSLSFATASPNNLLGIGSRRCDPEIFDLLSSLQSYLTPAKSQMMSIIRWDPPVSKSRQGRIQQNNSLDAMDRQQEQQQRDSEELEAAGEQKTRIGGWNDAYIANSLLLQGYSSFLTWFPAPPTHLMSLRQLPKLPPLAVQRLLVLLR